MGKYTAGRAGQLRIQGPEIDVDVVVRGESITYMVVENGSLRKEYFGVLREVTVRRDKISCYAPFFSQYRSIPLSDRNYMVESAAKSMDAADIIEAYKAVLESIATKFKSEFSTARSQSEKERTRELIDVLERLRSNIAMSEIITDPSVYAKRLQQAMDVA